MTAPTMEQLGLAIEPTPAMLKGEQTVWQCSHCGTVVVLTNLVTQITGRPVGRAPQGQCPGCMKPLGKWWAQQLPVAGIRKTEDS